MKIIIEGEPEEIAALEQKLKGGKTQQIFNTYNSEISPEKSSKRLRESASDMICRHW